MSCHGLTDAGQGHPRRGLSRREGSRVPLACDLSETLEEGAGA